MTELLDAVKGSPLLLAFVVVIAALVYAVEKLGGVNGPISRAVAAWQNRELNKLRREALYRAERRRIDAEAEGEQVRDLRTEVGWLRHEAADYRARDRARGEYERAIASYLDYVLRAARRAGVNLAPPPAPPNLAPLYVEGDERDDAGPSTNPMRRARRETTRPPVPGR